MPILKKEDSNDEASAVNFLVIKFTTAMDTAPRKTNIAPIVEIESSPNGSAEITTPIKPNIITLTLTILMLSFKKKCERTNKIRGELNIIRYTADKGSRIIPFKTNKNPTECITPLTSWNL